MDARLEAAHDGWKALLRHPRACPAGLPVGAPEQVDARLEAAHDARGAWTPSPADLPVAAPQRMDARLEAAHDAWGA